MNKFNGAKAISSDQYFGRKEEETSSGRPSFDGNMDGVAREIAQKFVEQAQADLSTLKNVAEVGAKKLADYWKQ